MTDIVKITISEKALYRLKSEAGVDEIFNSMYPDPKPNDDVKLLIVRAIMTGQKQGNASDILVEP